LKNNEEASYNQAIHYISHALFHQGTVHEIGFHKVSILELDEEDPG